MVLCFFYLWTILTVMVVVLPVPAPAKDQVRGLGVFDEGELAGFQR
jgi:hypothetical protein